MPCLTRGDKLPARVSRLALFSYIQKQAALATLSPADGAAVRALSSCTDGEITRLFHTINDEHPGEKRGNAAFFAGECKICRG